jgi:hypothetical protein
LWCEGIGGPTPRSVREAATAVAAAVTQEKAS